MAAKKKPSKKKPDFEKKYVLLDADYDPCDNPFDAEGEARRAAVVRTKDLITEGYDPAGTVTYVAVVIGGARDPRAADCDPEVEEF